MVKSDIIIVHNQDAIKDIGLDNLSCCFSGHRASKMPYSDISTKHKHLEDLLTQVIDDCILKGVVDFYVGGQNGIDTLAGLLVLWIKDLTRANINLHLVLPYKDFDATFTPLQRDDFEWIKKYAASVKYIHDNYTKSCFRDRNQYMIDKSDYLIAVCKKGHARSGTRMTINMAKKRGIEVIWIDPITQ
jgi:uncharacterized phage-like protein YoqJ